MGVFEKNYVRHLKVNCHQFYIIKNITKHVINNMFGPQLKQKLALFMCSKKCGDNAASVATFVATLVFTLDTADLECRKS